MFCIVDKKHRVWTVIVYIDYFSDFFVKQRQKVKDKINWTFDLIEELHRVPETYLKHPEAPTDFMKSEVNKALTFFGSAFLTTNN